LGATRRASAVARARSKGGKAVVQKGLKKKHRVRIESQPPLGGEKRRVQRSGGKREGNLSRKQSPACYEKEAGGSFCSEPIALKRKGRGDQRVRKIE